VSGGAQSRIGRLAQIFGSRARLPGQIPLNRTFSYFWGYCEHDLSTNGLDPESVPDVAVATLSVGQHASEVNWLSGESSKDRRPDRTRRPL
jgi:hypothetical protein